MRPPFAQKHGSTIKDRFAMMLGGRPVTYWKKEWSVPRDQAAKISAFGKRSHLNFILDNKKSWSAQVKEGMVAKW